MSNHHYGRISRYIVAHPTLINLLHTHIHSHNSINVSDKHQL